MNGHSSAARSIARGRNTPLAAAILVAAVAAPRALHSPCDAVAFADDPAPFVPGEISIGEPLPLPARSAPTPPPPSFTAPSATPAAAAPLPGTSTGVETKTGDMPPAAGWFGWTLDDSLVAGRLVVAEVTPDGPAARAGIRPQDMLLAIDGHRLGSADELAAVLAGIPAGRAVPASVARATGIEELMITPEVRPRAGAAARAAATKPPQPAATVTQAADWQPLSGAAASRDGTAADGTRSVLAPPASPLRRPPASGPTAAAPAAVVPAAAALAPPPRRLDADGPVAGRPALGVRTLPVDPATQSRFGLTHASGALVIGVVHELPAARAGVPPGAVIVALDERPVESPADLARLVADGPVGTPLTVRFVLPGGHTREAEVALERLPPAVERALAQPAAIAPGASSADE